MHWLVCPYWLYALNISRCVLGHATTKVGTCPGVRMCFPCDLAFHWTQIQMSLCEIDQNLFCLFVFAFTQH